MSRAQPRGLPAPLAKEAAKRATEAAERNRIEAVELARLVQERTVSVAAAFYDIGEALAKLREKRLYSALGHDTFNALLQDRLKLSRAQAYRFIAIAQRLTRSRALELGPRRSVALLRLAEATPGLDSVEDLLRDGVTLPGRKGPVPITKLTAEEVESAARAVVRAHRCPKERVSTADAFAAEKFAARVFERLTRAGISRGRVEVRRKERPGGPEELMLRIEIPFEARQALATALKSG